jgi:hypothetical protein
LLVAGIWVSGDVLSPTQIKQILFQFELSFSGAFFMIFLIKQREKKSGENSSIHR